MAISNFNFYISHVLKEEADQIKISNIKFQICLTFPWPARGGALYGLLSCRDYSCLLMKSKREERASARQQYLLKSINL